LLLLDKNPTKSVAELKSSAGGFGPSSFGGGGLKNEEGKKALMKEFPLLEKSGGLGSMNLGSSKA
jgi:hypothetical protein